MIVTRKQLDTLKCIHPNCKDPNHELILHSKCHIDYPTQAIKSDDILEIQCAKCGKLIFDIAITFGYGENVALKEIQCGNKFCKHRHFILLPACHNAPIWALYHKKTGTIEIRCAECKRSVYVAEVKKE